MKQNKTKLKLISIILFIFLAIFFVGCQSNIKDIKQTDTDIIKIGVILPLSGDVAVFGESSKNAIEMALRETPENIRNKIKIIYEDDQFNPVNTISAFQKLNTVDNIDVLITFTSAPSNAVASLAEANQIPMIASTTGSADTVDGREWVTKHWVTPQQLAITLIPEMEKRYDNIVAVWAQEEGVAAIKEAFYENIGDSVSMVLDDYEVSADEMDFKNIIIDAKNKDAEAILVRLLPGQTGLFFKQANELEYHGKLFGFETFESADDVELSQNTMIGSWYVNSAQVSNNFVNNYKNMYGIEPTIGAANTYDIAKIIISQIKEFEPDMTKKEKQILINNKLHELKDYYGATGTYSSDGNNGFTIPVVLKIVTEDGFKELTS